MLIALMLAAGVSTAPPLPQDVPASATLYEVRLVGSTAGQLAVWDQDGAQRIFFQYNDRGRGPKSYATLVRAADGTTRSLTVEGTGYMKDPVHETFSMQDGVASWKNKAEQGNQRLAGPAFYVSMSGPPLEIALLAQAALRNGGSIALLPDGAAQVRQVARHGPATLYAVSGLDFSPQYVWLDKSGQFLALADFWLAVIREGQQKLLPELEKAQKAAMAQRARELARRLVRRPSGKLVLHDASVFDSERAEVQQHQDVVIEGNRIVSVGPTGPVPSGAEVIEAAGKMVLPGLWDLHAHVADNDGLLNLRAGVTTVRDMGNDADDLAARIGRIERGDEVGTRILRAGLMDGPGPLHAPTKVLVNSAAEARKWVDWYADHGYVQVKLYSSLDPNLIAPIAEEAHRRGLRVSGHVPSGTFADACVRSGYDEIQHVNFLALNFMRDVTETRGPQRFTAVAERAAGLDLAGAEVRSFVSLLRERHAAVDPTLSLFETVLTGKPGEMPPAFRSVAARLPTAVRRWLASGDLAVPSQDPGRAQASWQKLLGLVRELWAAGVQVESGTDSIAGFALQRELELHVQAGIPAAQVLQEATLGAARLAGQDKEVGSVRQGKLADLVLVAGDPLREIGQVRNVVLTVRDGVVYRPAELERELGMAAPR